MARAIAAPAAVEATAAADAKRVRGGSGTADRSAERRDDGEQRAANRSGDRDADRQRQAVPRDPDRGGYRDSGRPNNAPIIVNRNRPGTNVYVGSSYRGPRYYAPVHYDRWARSYYHWSPIGYVPWSLISRSIGSANFSVYGRYSAYGVTGVLMVHRTHLHRTHLARYPAMTLARYG